MQVVNNLMKGQGAVEYLIILAVVILIALVIVSVLYSLGIFKFRNKVGLDIALEALRETWRARKATMDELWEAAKVCRVANVMRPYLEMV